MKAGNNFNLIRLVLALSVCLYHIHALTGMKHFSIFSEWFNAEEAVNAFFILSGFLIYSSFERNPSWTDYAARRFFRIVPAYGVVVVLAAVGLCFLSNYAISDYFLSPTWWQYIVYNLLFLNFMQPNLPGVFADHILSAVNGSLWSLKIEVGFYILLPFVFYWLRGGSFWLRWCFLMMASVAYRLGLQSTFDVAGGQHWLFLSRQVPGQLYYFLLGIAVTQVQSLPRFRKGLQLFGSASFFILIVFTVPIWIKPLLLTGALFWIAFAIPVVHGPWQQEDISYGVYIYHFPLIQIGIDCGWFQYSAWGCFALILLLCLLAGFLSWRWIEQPSLRASTGKLLHQIRFR